jgi:hypothetical protein
MFLVALTRLEGEDIASHHVTLGLAIPDNGGGLMSLPTPPYLCASSDTIVPSGCLLNLTSNSFSIK